MITLYNEKDEKLKLISVFEFNDAAMGESSISATVSFDKEQDFHPDWYVVYNGEKFHLGVRKPTGKKDTSSLSTTYTLVFKSEREDLKRYTFMDFVELGTGNPQPSSYNVPLYATLSEFVDRFNLNLRHYMGSRWQMVLPADYVEDGNAISVAFDNASLWDVLLRVYEVFGVRWTIHSAGDILQIQVGFQEVEIEHVFEYGKDNGLVSVERNNALERIITRLRGRGSERNLPADYFHTGDPDTNSFLQATYFKNLMPKAYRDYIRGYNAGSGTGSWAYNQGVADRVSGRDISPVDYAISDKEDLWGISYGAIMPNELIYPTLQGATRNGVRLDEVLAVEQVLVDGVREPQNVIAVGIGPGGQESSSGKCGNSQRNGYLADCRGGIDFTILTDRFQVANPINTAQVRITLTPSYISSEGLPVPVEFGSASTVRSSAELQLVDFAGSATGEIIRTQTITDTDTYLWELDNIPAGDYRFRANVTWSADIPANDREVVVNVDTRLTGATVKEYARETDKGEFKETFDIEIRDVWGVARNAGESDEDYTYRVWSPRAVSEDMTVMFSDGLLAGEDYEFRIVGFNSNADDLRQTIVTAIKPTSDGGWKLTLQKSDAELEAGNIYLPNTMQNAKAGDHFFFVNIFMPYDPYVYDAEERLQAYLDSQLSLKDEEYPSFTITPSKIFCSSFAEADKIQAGAKIRVRNTALVGDSYISLYIQSLTKRYSANSLNPEWSLTISDLVVASGNPVETLQGEVDVLSQRFYNNRSAVQEAVRSLSSTFLRKDGIADVSYSPTEFKKQVKLGEGIADEDFINGDISGKGFGVYTDGDGNRVIEADVLVGRIGARFNEVVINQVTYSAGKQVFSSAGMVVSKVGDAGTSWRCYFDTKNATVRNYFAVGDGAFSQRFTDSGIRQYWARVTAVGSDYIEISKTDRMQGSFDPIVGDNIAQLGNKTDKSRQAALVIDETREGGGLVTWYDDITDFTLSNKDSVNIGRIAETIEVDGVPQTGYKTWLQVYGSAFIGNKDKSQFVEFDNKTLKLKGRLEVGSTISNAMTVVEDGLIQSALLKLGYYNDDVFKIMSGTNGLYDSTKKGGGIAAWYGGPMADKEADSALAEYAQSLFRFDGSGYLAGGNITWDKDGAGSVAGGDIAWDKDGAITLGVGIKISGDENETLGSILNSINKFLSWFDEDRDGDIYVKGNKNFYTYGAISFGGKSTSGGGGGGVTTLTKEMVIQALGYTPYDATNPAKYITSGALVGYAKLTDIPSIPTALPNPYKLSINGTPYDGSSAQSINITAESLGALTEDDAESTYATITALNGLQASHNALRNEFDALNKVLNDDVSGKINTWNEVVNFLDEYSGSQDLATILSGMNGNITTLQGYFTGGKAKKAVEADRLSDTSTYKAWGQTFFENGVPKSVSGNIDLNISEIFNAVAISCYDSNTGYYVGSRNNGLGVTTGGLLLLSYGATPMSFFTNSSERIHIAVGGYVGIGTPSPAYELDVNGNIHTSAALVVGSTQVTEKSQNNTKYLEVDGNLVVKGSISFGGYGEGSTGSGGITEVTKEMVISALGYTPYNASNPSKYATEDWVTSKLSSVSGFDESKMWTALGTDSTTKKISANYIGDLSGKYLLLDKVSEQSVAYATSAGDADTLDGIQYQNILERSYSRTAQLTTAGWYRIAKMHDITGASCTLYLYHNYFHTNNCSYIFSITCAYNNVNITQIGGATNTRTIDKVRVSHNGGERYIDIHLTGTANFNDYYWTIVGAAEAIDVISNPTALAYNTEFATAWTGIKTESLTIGSTLIEEKEQNNTKYVEIDGNLVVKGSISFGGAGTSGGTSGGLTSFQITIGNLVYASEGNNITIPASSLRSALSINNVTNLAARDYLTDLSSNTTNAVSLTIGGTTKYITTTALKTSLGLGSLAYKSSLAASDIPSLDWSKITTGKPTTLSGYGITDALPNTTKYALGDAVGGNAVSANKLATARSLWGHTFNGTDDVKGSIEHCTYLRYYTSTSESGYILGRSEEIVGGSGLALWTYGNTPIVLGAGSYERMRINENGNVSMGYTGDGGAKLYVAGNIVATGAITFGSSASDMRLKDVTSRDYDAVSILRGLSTFKYRWNSTAKGLTDNFANDNDEHFGLSAQELQKVSNYLVSNFDYGSGKEYLVLRKEEIVPLLVQAVKQLLDRIERVENNGSKQ